MLHGSSSSVPGSCGFIILSDIIRRKFYIKCLWAIVIIRRVVSVTQQTEWLLQITKWGCSCIGFLQLHTVKLIIVALWRVVTLTHNKVQSTAVSQPCFAFVMLWKRRFLFGCERNLYFSFDSFFPQTTEMVVNLELQVNTVL